MTLIVNLVFQGDIPETSTVSFAAFSVMNSVVRFAFDVLLNVTLFFGLKEMLKDVDLSGQKET